MSDKENVTVGCSSGAKITKWAFAT